MQKKILKFIVISLAILIIFAFIALIYGMYSKFSSKTNDMTTDPKKTSLNLVEGEEIIDIEVIDENRLLIIIESSGNFKGVVYNINQNRILNIIEK